MIFAMQISYAALILLSTRYFFDNPVNPDFGLRTPGSGRWSRSSPKFIPLVPGPCPTPPRNFVKIRSELFPLSEGQTNRQTNKQTEVKTLPPSWAEVTSELTNKRALAEVMMTKYTREDLSE